MKLVSFTIENVAFFLSLGKISFVPPEYLDAILEG